MVRLLILLRSVSVFRTSSGKFKVVHLPSLSSRPSSIINFYLTWKTSRNPSLGAEKESSLRRKLSSFLRLLSSSPPFTRNYLHWQSVRERALSWLTSAIWPVWHFFYVIVPFLFLLFATYDRLSLQEVNHSQSNSKKSYGIKKKPNNQRTPS